MLASRPTGSTGPIAADDLIELVVAPIIYRVIFLPWTLTPDLAQRCVDRLLGADRPAA